MRFRTKLLMTLTASLALGYSAMSPAAEEREAGIGKERARGAVFVMTNSADRVRGNEIAMYDRDRAGDLKLIGYFPTGNLGAGQPQLGSGPAPTTNLLDGALGGPVPLTADGLTSAESLILGPGNRCLFAVNAGSNSVSSFRVRSNGLELASAVSSQGGLDARFPASLAVSGNLLYVVNAGDQGSLAGFRVSASCALAPLAGSSRDLHGLTNSVLTPEPADVFTTPGQVSFSPDGKRLALSIKGGPDGAGFFPSGRVVVYPVGANGLLGAPAVTPFSFAQGTGGPFGFIFTDAETLIVTHGNSQSIASYRITAANTLSRISDVLQTGDLAPCWIDKAGNFAYVADFGGIPAAGRSPDADGLLDGFKINPDGTLTALGVSKRYPSPGPGRSGNHGIDIRIVGKYLYFIQPRSGQVGRYTIGNDGSLTGLASFGGLMPGAEPFVGYNPGINNFTEACFLQGPNTSPECQQGSAQGIAGY